MTNPFYLTRFWKDLRKLALERDGYRCTVPGCRQTAATSRLYVDHVTTRPNVPHPTGADTLGNLRTYCAMHDGQVKEMTNGKRRRDGKAFVRGCDPSGKPLDPNHHWLKRGRP